MRGTVWKALRGVLKELTLLYFALRDPRTPWGTKLLALGTVLYVVSPIDLVPDFVPLVGWLDDLVVLPAMIYLLITLTPAEVLSDAEMKTQLMHRWKTRALLILGGVLVLIGGCIVLAERS